MKLFILSIPSKRFCTSEAPLARISQEKAYPLYWYLPYIFISIALMAIVAFPQYCY